jgi:colanic acid/amylovoran biosynthesis glycosyltransferase
LLHQPGQSMRLWWRAVARYGYGWRASKAWIMALPLILGQYDLIHFEYSGLAVSYLDALPLLAPAKLLTSCRGAAEQIVPLVKPERAVRLRQLFPLLDRVHCVSADIQGTVEDYGLQPGQAFVNHPAIDPNQFRRQSPYPAKECGPFNLVSIGRLHWKKGLEYGLLAVRQSIDEGYDIFYDILGGGVEEERLRFAIQDMDLSERIRLHGRQPATRVRQALEEADIYLLPSLSEGISNSALEAMAMELPVVSTTAGGMSEVITDGCEGLLVPPRQPTAMAEKVRYLLADSGLRRKMGQLGRERIIRHFNLRKQTNCFITEYQALLKETIRN